MVSMYGLYEKPQPRRIEAMAKRIAETENEALLKQCGAKQRRARLKQNLDITIFYHRIFNRCVHLITSSKGYYENADFWLILNYYADDDNEPYFRTHIRENGRTHKDIPDGYKPLHKNIEKAEFTHFKGFAPALEPQRLKIMQSGRRTSVAELHYYYKTESFYNELMDILSNPKI